MGKIKREQSTPTKISRNTGKQASSPKKISRDTGSKKASASAEDFGSNAEMIEQVKSAEECNPDLKTDVLNPYSVTADTLMGGPAAAVGGVVGNLANRVVGDLAEDLGAPCNAVDTYRGVTTMLNPLSSGEDIVAVMEALDPVYDKYYDEFIETIKSPDKKTTIGTLADGPGAWLGAPFDWISSQF